MAANTNYLDFDQEVRNDVLEAIRAGDVPALQHLIDTRFGVNNDSNTDCLYRAVREGNSQIVKMLLDAGIRREYYRINVNVDEDQDDEHQAIANLDERADAFLDRAENRARASPLYFAIRLQDDELRWTMVKLLVDNGISPRNEHLYSPSALFLAVLQGDYEMVKYLLDAGAQVDCVCDYGKGFTTLHGAVVYLSGEIRVNMVRLLLKFGADVNAKGPIHRERCVQLVFEEQLGRCEVLQLLIDAGAELNYLDENYESPLAIAASLGDCEAMRQLITAGADVNLSNRCSSSPLHLAVYMYQRESVRVLLENGANLNIKDEDGKGILCFAAELDNKNKKEEYIDIMRMLIAHGAEINCNQFEYFLPFVTVIRSGTMEAMQLFFEHGITLENCGSSHLLRHAAENEETDIMKYLLETFQYDVNEIHREGDREFTPLFVAVDTDQKHNAQLLIEYGADVHIPCVHYGVNNSDFTASSPLFAALNYGDSRMVDLLLSAGANLNVDTNDHLWQPIMVKVLQPEFYEMLSSLIGESTLLQSRETFDLKNRNVIVERFANFSLEIEKQCLAELEALKNITFYGSVTLYDMLGGKDVTRFVRSNHVAETFKSQKVVECFPIYGNRIEYCYILAKSKREVMDKAIRKLNEILQFCFRHYHEILYIILSHLRLQDLHILSIV